MVSKNGPWPQLESIKATCVSAFCDKKTNKKTVFPGRVMNGGAAGRPAVDQEASMANGDNLSAAWFHILLYMRQTLR